MFILLKGAFAAFASARDALVTVLFFDRIPFAILFPTLCPLRSAAGSVVFRAAFTAFETFLALETAFVPPLEIVLEKLLIDVDAILFNGFNPVSMLSVTAVPALVPAEVKAPLPLLMPDVIALIAVSPILLADAATLPIPD